MKMYRCSAIQYKKKEEIDLSFSPLPSYFALKPVRPIHTIPEHSREIWLDKIPMDLGKLKVLVSRPAARSFFSELGTSGIFSFFH